MLHVRVARRTFLAASLAAAASTVLYARFHELNDVTVERLELTLGSRGASLRVVHLSALHLHQGEGVTVPEVGRKPGLQAAGRIAGNRYLHGFVLLADQGRFATSRVGFCAFAQK